jgi:Flp pilus assembly pilin Flp
MGAAAKDFALAAALVAMALIVGWFLAGAVSWFFEEGPGTSLLWGRA